jgi:hypothetical protein
MGVSPIQAGSYGKLWTITLNTDSGADNLTGIVVANISIIIKNMSSLVETTSTGAITIVTANPAVITWQPTSADAGTPGYYNVIPQVTFSTGPFRYDPIPWLIQPA